MVAKKLGKGSDFLPAIGPSGSVKKCSIKKSYDWLKSVECTVRPTTSSTTDVSTVPRLIVDGLDPEQIWQQLKLQNDFKFRRLRKILRSNSGSFSNSCLLKDTLLVDKRSQNGAQESFVEEDDGENSEINDEEPVDDNPGPEVPAQGKLVGQQQPETEVDDEFFKLREMEEFLVAEELKESNEDVDSDEEVIDHFEEVLSDSDEDRGDDICYEKFFDLPADVSKSSKLKRFKVSFADNEKEDTGSDFSGENREIEHELKKNDEQNESGEEYESQQKAAKSKLELRNSSLQTKIGALEAENLAPKSWQMTGEISGKERPQNALLEEHLGYEANIRMAPVITEDFTETLENVIRQRIKDRTWDDVEKKEKPIEAPKAYRNELVLDQEKSKVSLSQVYEQEFLKQSNKEKAEDSNPKHVEIRKDMKSLFDKLDALSNYHYAPKPPAPEIKVVKNTRSLRMEEVAPVSVTEASLLTAEEVKTPAVGELKHNSEKDKTDKKRERRKKKDVNRKKAQLRELKEAKRGVPKDKVKALEKIGKIKKAKRAIEGSKSSMKSAEFFNKMQKEVSDKVKAVSKSRDSAKKNKTAGRGADYKL